MTLSLKPRPVLLFTAACSLALSACDGSSSSVPANDANSLAATLVAPIRANEDALRNAVLPPRFQLRMSECTNVPAGYSPLVDAQVMFLDAEGNEIAGPMAITDECGFFSTAVPSGTESIGASSAGNKPLVASIEAIQASDFVASTIPVDADYRVGFLSAYDDNTLGFTITDSVTNKAVVGLSASAFSITVDNVNQVFSDITTGLTGDDASIVIVSDASGSMVINAFTDEDGTRYSRNQLAANAAHQFLDRKGVNDEVALLIFGSDSDFIDKQAVDDLLAPTDADGNPFDLPYPASGFSTNSADLRLIVDAYNRDSKLWSEFNSDEVHPDSAKVTLSRSYPFGGATAFYNSTVEASNRLVTQSNPRKFILAMTDGQNNMGGSIDEVVSTANANRTPVYTIGFAQSDRTDLDQIAADTGATYFQAESLDISDAYNSIQTNIQFQYIGSLSNPTTGANQVLLSFDINGDGVPEATRTTTVTAPTE